MPEYRIGEKVERTATEGMKQGQCTLQGEPSEVEGRVKCGLVVCPYCYTAMWITSGWGDYYTCDRCNRDFK